MDNRTFILKNESELDPVVEALENKLRPGDWVALEGDLGVGKTTLVRHFLHKLGWESEVVSPTYPILVEYEVGSQKIIHIDGFRLSHVAPDPWDWREWGSAIVFVEWPERTHLAPERFRWRIRIVADSASNERKIRIDRVLTSA